MAANSLFASRILASRITNGRDTFCGQKDVWNIESFRQVDLRTYRLPERRWDHKLTIHRYDTYLPPYDTT
jgi:hypothetical protein